MLDSIQTAHWQYENSSVATDSIITAFKNGTTLDIDKYHVNGTTVAELKTEQEKQLQNDTQSIIDHFSPQQRRVISRTLNLHGKRLVAAEINPLLVFIKDWIGYRVKKNPDKPQLVNKLLLCCQIAVYFNVLCGKRGEGGGNPATPLKFTFKLCNTSL